MIITINGNHGSGKSTIAKKIASNLGFEHYSTGDIFRDLAEKRGLTLVEYLETGETDPSVDKEVDNYTTELGKEKDNFVIDSRLAWHFIPDSMKIFLKVDERVGMERMFGHRKKGSNRSNEDSNIESIEDVIKSNRKRKETDLKRYEMYYGVNPFNEENYELVLDTTNLGIEEVFEEVLHFVKERMEVE